MASKGQKSTWEHLKWVAQRVDRDLQISIEDKRPLDPPGKAVSLPTPAFLIRNPI